MKKLRSDIYLKAKKAIKEYGRPLEQSLLQLYFEDGDEKSVVKTLKQYQNADGGFGNALEPDFRLPESSAAATNIALRQLTALSETGDVLPIIEKAVRYLESTYDPKRNGWYNVPIEVNDYPHASWWQVDPDTSMSGLDSHWGNPNAELVGYLHKYREFLDTINADNLVQYALDHLYNLSSYGDHEVYSYIQLYQFLDHSQKEKVEDILILAVNDIVSLNINEWEQYVPTPLDIVKSPSDPKFGLYDPAIEDNLDYLIDKLTQYGLIGPTWSWSNYEDTWKQARNEWIGIQTLKILHILDNFNRIER